MSPIHFWVGIGPTRDVMQNVQSIVAPSVLAADYGSLDDEIKDIERSGADWHHVDIMDGHFVPNISFGPDVQKIIAKNAKIPLDTHLMISHPLQYVEAFSEAGSAGITIHVECNDPIDQTLQAITDLGVKPGITLKPKTAVEKLEPWLDRVDLILVMTVEPGFGGQSFMHDMVKKVEWLDQKRKEHNYNYLIEVDGGINQETGSICRQAGADVLVAGTYLYRAENRTQAINSLKSPN